MKNYKRIVLNDIILTTLLDTITSNYKDYRLVQVIKDSSINNSIEYHAVLEKEITEEIAENGTNIDPIDEIFNKNSSYNEKTDEVKHNYGV